MKKSIALFIIIICLITTGCGTSKFGGAITGTQPLNDPKITYGEFPFEITYMINNETITVKDVYVCEYVGAFWDWNRGHFREWKGYVKNTNESSLLITEDADRKIYCFVGSAEFYMDDEEYPEQKPLSPRVFDVEKNDNINAEIMFFSSEEIMQYYGIKIISWNFSEPIINSFE